MKTEKLLTVYDQFQKDWAWIANDSEENLPSRHSPTAPSADKETDWLLCPLLSFGDYDNSCQVERSNVRVFLQMFGKLPEVVCMHFAYNSQVIAIKGTCNDSELLDVLEGLDDYPIIDENDSQAMEMELIDEAWSNFGESDFLSAIQKKFDADDIEVKEGADLFDIYRKASEEANCYAEIECGGNVYFNFDKVVQFVSEENFNLETY
jgi:hypothetical protein